MRFVLFLYSIIVGLNCVADGTITNYNENDDFNNVDIQDNLWDLQSSQVLRRKQFWINDAEQTLLEKLQHMRPNRNVAKNVIFFIGDGMSVPTVTASRIYDGQLRGIVGERNRLSFEKFPYTGLSKVADSACSASAYLCGIKANYKTIGVTANVTLNGCTESRSPQNQLQSIAGWAIAAGKSAGIVTTTRITHASPAGTYASTSNREFESDFDIYKMMGHEYNTDCIDIASQLIENEISKHFTVIFGGGSTKFLSNNTKDDQGNTGERLDGRNLIYEWAALKKLEGKRAKFISNREQLLNLDVGHTDNVMGLFSPSHMSYNLDTNQNGERSQPSLEEMTEVAIEMLQKNEQGYFLFVEGGRIDHAHHETKAKKALDETVQFSRAVQRALKLTDPSNTLIVVSADHGHTMTVNGYPELNQSITGLSGINALDGLPYSTISYANGPAFEKFYSNGEDGKVHRVDLFELFAKADNNLRFPSAVPLSEETHGGGDVAIYSTGPWAHLFTGVMEQSVLPHLMGFASCTGPGLHSCQRTDLFKNLETE